MARTSVEDLGRRLERALTPEQRALLDTVRAVAGASGLAAYLVGGSVRDLLLGVRSPDLDVTVVGNAVDLARQVAARLELKPPAVHQVFGTATVRLGAAWVDVITARRETYRHPGALPEVTAAGIGDDLARRDFSINAMALALTGADAGRLLDPYHGREDLRRGQIRVLHERSFEDDATRLLRAARYAGRFGFVLEETTAEWAERALPFLAAISAARVRQEMLRAFREPRPVPVLEAVQRLGIPPALVPGMTFDHRALPGWRRLGGTDWLRLPLVWAIGALSLPDGARVRYVERFALTHAEGQAVRALAPAAAALATLVQHSPARPSATVAALERFPEPSLAALSLACEGTPAAALADRYLTDLRHVRPALGARGLMAMGVPEGPLLGALLRRLRDARLDDPALSLDAERRLVQDMLNAQPGA